MTRFARLAALFLAPFILVACEEKPKIDQEKLKRVTGTIHGAFYDQNGDIVMLNDAERDFYLTMILPRPLPAAVPALGGPGGAALAKALSYTERCRAAGVPIFPPLPLSEPPWKKFKPLPKRKVFSAPSYQPATPWRWDAPDKSGFCVALQRNDKNDATKLHEIGFICYSETTGKTCFWAAHDLSTGKLLKTDADLKKRTTETIRGADTVGLNCAKCHRGFEPFIVHPGTSLQKATKLKDTDRPRLMHVAPLEKKRALEWVNGEPLDLGNEGCGQCHNFAQPTKEWCEGVLKPALGKAKGFFEENPKRFIPPPVATMPVESSGDKKAIPQDKWDAATKADVKTLSDLCKELGVDLEIKLAGP